MSLNFIQSSKQFICNLYFLFLLNLGFSLTVFAQSVQVGNGSYSTTLPSGEIGPQNSSGQHILPKVSNSFDQRIQTNDWWSSLIFPFFGNPHSGKLIAHPLSMQAVADGLQLNYTYQHTFATSAPGTDYLFPYYPDGQMTVGVSGLNASKTTTHNYDDWTVTAEWLDGGKNMLATIGHGLPFVYFEISGGDAAINFNGTPTVWFNNNGVLGVSVDGRHYGIFAPTGSTWNSGSTYTSNLNGENYLSVALLPDNSQTTLNEFKSRAYAFVTNSLVEWSYDESTATLTSTYSYETTLKDSAEGNINETVSALYRHQWLHVNESLTNHSYVSPRGEMKVLYGNSFTTNLKFQGVLPILPNQGDYNPEILKDLIKEVAEESLGVGPSYENGKAMARFANLVHIADQMGLTSERDYFLAALKTRLEDWFTVGGDQEYSYNSNWDVLTGYPSGYGADNQINDHHFHMSYAIVSAATIAKYDPTWASQEQWGGMVNMLIRDANNWNRDDELLPFLRSFDIYAGHSWAAGHGDFAEGNNQESSSESMNFASATILWGEVTGQTEIRDLGIFLYATETIAVEQYWFDIDNEVFPEDYPHNAIGMVWGSKGVHATWFGGAPEFVRGINILPITSGSLYLGRYPEYVSANYDQIVEIGSGPPELWKDLFWLYLSMSDANQALTNYLAESATVNFNDHDEVFNGLSQPFTMHWLYNMKRMGHVDASVTADIPTYAVFKKGDAKTYIAYNAGSTDRVVTFSDGYSMTVPAGDLHTESTELVNPNAPVVILTADKTRGKSPLNIQFNASNSFDRNDLDLSFNWNFGGIATSTATDTTFTFTEVGEYNVLLTVTNTDGLSSADSLKITVLPNGTAYGGTPPIIPTTIEAEHYDEGGEGIAYHDTDANNQFYRSGEGVDLGADGGSVHVLFIIASEWIEYTFEVAESGNYKFIPYMATVPGFGNFTMLIDNEDVSGKIRVNGTGSFINFQPFEIEPTYLESGVHVMRFEFDTDFASEQKNWLFSFDKTVVKRVDDTSDETDMDIPSNFSLQQNYPNPFNPSTNISYNLPKNGHVHLKIYNTLGQTVQVLVDELKNAGNHTAIFDASSLSSGVYIYQIEYEGEILSKKMILMK